MVARTGNLNIDSAWADLEADHSLGTLKRVDESHPSAFYATRDFEGRRGLLLISSTQPPRFAQLRAVETKVIQIERDGWQTYIWLCDSDLAPIFSLLCRDLMECSQDSPEVRTPALIAGRIARWRRMFEAGKSNTLPPTELRGLVGELTVLREALDRMPVADAVLGWQGPLDAPQDFAFAAMLIEVKTVGPTALRARIGSADQLDVEKERRLLLGLVRLEPATLETVGKFAVSELVADIRSKLEPWAEATFEFGSRLIAAGYNGHPDYSKEYFRIGSVRYYCVEESFPRLVRADLMPGIADASYEIALSTISDFECAL
jgi:hypothetical protein